MKYPSNGTNSNPWNPLLSRRGKRAIGKIEATRSRVLPPKGKGKADSWDTDVGVPAWSRGKQPMTRRTRRRRKGVWRETTEVLH